MPFNSDKRPSRPPHHRKPALPKWIFPQASDAPQGNDLPSPITPLDADNGKRPPVPGHDGGDELDDDGDDVQHDVDLPTLLGPGDDDELDDDGVPPFPWGDDDEDVQHEDDGDDDTNLDDDGVPPFPGHEDPSAVPESDPHVTGARAPTDIPPVPTTIGPAQMLRSVLKAQPPKPAKHMKARLTPVVLVPGWIRDAVTRVQDRIALAQLNYWVHPSRCLTVVPRGVPSQSTARTAKQFAASTGLTEAQVDTALQHLQEAGLIDWETHLFHGQRKRFIWLLDAAYERETGGSSHRQIAYRPSFAQYLRRRTSGKLQVDLCTAGLLISQMHYWISREARTAATKQTADALVRRYFVSTLKDLAEQIGISYTAAGRSAKLLRKTGLIVTRREKRTGGDVGMKFHMTDLGWSLAENGYASESGTEDK